ncbi:MAG: VCBS repeat-containing protein [Phycisphaeraceae bacterium]|nr:MAG: VCBS repeat-containing protein [Phycisphaeraceae bacterium]
MPSPAHTAAGLLSIALASGAMACPPGEMFEHQGVRTIPNTDSNKLIVTDVNGDGSPDLIAFSSTEIGVHINDGTGGFGPPIVSPLHGQFSSFFFRVHSCDVDNDGDVDLVVNERSGTPAIEVYTNDGTGVFTFSHAVPLDPSVCCAEVISADGDVDGDGLPDLVVWYWWSTVSAVYRNMDGVFDGTHWDFPMSSGGPANSGILALDINRDGLTDIVVGSNVYLGTPDGPSEPVPSLVGFSFRCDHVFVDDFDRDGFNDIAGDTTHSPDNVKIAFGSADGSLDVTADVAEVSDACRLVIRPDPTDTGGSPSWILRTDELPGIYRLTVDSDRVPALERLYDSSGQDLPTPDFIADADQDGDGDLYVAYGSYSSGTAWSIYARQADGSFLAEPGPYLYSIWNPDWNNDLNGDGVVDVMDIYRRTPTGDGLISIALSDGAGGYDAPRAENDWVAQQGGSQFTDLNGDGVPDLIASTYADNVILYAYGSPDGSYTPLNAVPTDGHMGAVAAGDYDGDGVVDLLAIRTADSPMRRVFVYRGDGNGGFVAGQVVNLPSSVTPAVPRLAAGDMDGDGGLDLIVSFEDGADRSLVYWQDPVTRAYTSYTRCDAPRPSQPRIADVNGDGRPDFVHGDASPAGAGGYAVVWLNNGDRTFQERRRDEHLALVPVGDLNGDGTSELVGLSPFVLYQSSGTTWTVATVTPRPGIASSIQDLQSGSAWDAAGADLDGDGDRDILIATDGGLAVVLNNGNGTYAFDGIYRGEISTGPDAVAVYDFDGDSMPDVALAHRRAVETRINRCEPPPPCPADLVEPFGVLDLADVIAFVTAFTGGNPAGDLDGNGLFDLTDVTIFVTSFMDGCP